MSRPVHIFNHIPRCGGTTVRTALREWFDIVEDYWEGWGGEQQREQYLQWPPVDLDKLQPNQLLAGHYVQDGLFLSQRYPAVYGNARYRLFTFVRDPLEQQESLYRMFHKYEQIEDDPGIDDFVMHPYRLFCTLFECGEDDFREKIADRYFFVGTQDLLQESLDLLARKLDKPPVSLEYYTLNATEASADLGTASTETAERFRERNAPDYELVDFCRQRLIEQLPRWEDVSLENLIRSDSGMTPVHPSDDGQPVRLLYRRRAGFRVFAADPATTRLELRLRPTETAKRVTLLLNGLDVHQQALPKPSAVKTLLTRPLELKAGANLIEIQVEGNAAAEEQRPATGDVHVESVRFVKPGWTAAARSLLGR